MKKSNITVMLAAAGLLSSMTIASQAYASAFQLFDQDASQLGNDYAGSIASANTPGTEFYNSAGMTHIKQTEMSFGATAINTNIKFTGYTAVDGLRTPASQNISQGGGLSVLPNFHVVAPIYKDWMAGFGLTVPFGLETNYPSYSSAANAATETSLRAINLGLSFAHPITNWMSIGFGVDEQQAEGIFDESLTTFAVHKEIHNRLTDWAPGWHAGLLFDLSKNTRLGLNYKSKVNHKAQGDSTVVTDSVGSTSNDTVTTQIILPPTTSLGLYSDVSDKWSLMTKIDYTQWSDLKGFVLDNVATGFPDGDQHIAIPQNYRNTWNFAIGADYHINTLWTWKVGAGVDESPVNTQDRNLRLPDNNHYIVSTGINYQANQNFTIDMGYMHVFVPHADINNTAIQIVGAVPINITENGVVNASADVLGAQITWKFM